MSNVLFIEERADTHLKKGDERKVFQCPCGCRAFRVYEDGMIMCAMCDKYSDDWPNTRDQFELKAAETPENSAEVCSLWRPKGGQNAD